MGEVVGAGLLAHVPDDHAAGGDPAGAQPRRGHHPGLRPAAAAREVFETLDYDTVVVLDSHWATTVEFVVTAHDRRAGPVHLRGAAARDVPSGPTTSPATPSSPTRSPRNADAHGTWITAIDDPYLPIFYATTNLWEYLGQGLRTSAGSRSASARPATPRTTCGSAGRSATRSRETDRKVLLIASGALSHTFWPLRQLREHEAAGVEHICTPEAAAADLERIDWFSDRRPRAGARDDAGVLPLQARGPVRPLPDDDRRARRGRLHRAPRASTASTRTRSAPARCTCGSTGPPTGSPPRAHDADLSS